MGPRRQLTSAFLEAACGCDASSTPDLEERLLELWEAGQSRWPQIQLAPLAFSRYLGERLAEPGKAAFPEPDRAGDLYLACACSLGDARAIAVFERELFKAIPAYVARMRLTKEAIEELKQLLRTRLFVADAGRAPVIAEYRGRGPLEAWLRVTTVHQALCVERSAASATAREAQATPSPQADAELQLIKHQHRAEFSAALEQAFALLSKDEKAVLRLHYLEGLTIDETAALFHVHRATVARWIARTRETILAETKRRLAEKLKLPAAELEGMFALVQSNLRVSIERFLKQTAPPGRPAPKGRS
jgi:RNA polymerase sigma-70 factor (ECF subfamily)